MISRVSILILYGLSRKNHLEFKKNISSWISLGNWLGLICRHPVTLVLVFRNLYVTFCGMEVPQSGNSGLRQPPAGPEMT